MFRSIKAIISPECGTRAEANVQFCGSDPPFMEVQVNLHRLVHNPQHSNPLNRVINNLHNRVINNLNSNSWLLGRIPV
jgi:hypothetical protein